MFEYVTRKCEKGTRSGDLMDSIVVGIMVLEAHCKHLKYGKSIYIFTDASSEINPDGLEDIKNKAIDYDVKVHVIGFGLSDEMPPENDMSVKATNERILRSVATDTGGEAFQGDEAIELLGELRAKTVKSAQLIKDTMSLGVAYSDASVTIDVMAFAKVMEMKLPSAKKWSKVAAEVADKGNEATYGEVKMDRTYKLVQQNLEDDAETGGIKLQDDVEIQKDELVKAYKYGRDLVPFAEEDIAAMKLTTEKGFMILGFVKDSEVIPDPAKPSSTVTFETLALALRLKKKYALVRYVRIRNAKPKLGVLIPHIGKKIWCAWVQTLGGTQSSQSLAASVTKGKSDQLITAAKKKTLSSKRLVSIEEADRRIDALIDSMDLMTAIEDDGETHEAYVPSEIFNPSYQRIYQCLSHRAINPDDKELPPIDPRFVAGILPMPELVERAKPIIESIKEAFKVEKVDEGKESNRTKFARQVDQAEATAEKLAMDTEGDAMNIDNMNLAMLKTSLVNSVGTADPVADFKAMLSRRDVDLVSTAISQMCNVIVTIVEKSFGTQLFTKATQCLTALREGCIVQSEVSTYNEWLPNFKKEILEKQPKFWDTLLEAENRKLGLITSEESAESSVTEDEAREFFAEDSAQPEEEAPPAADADEDDMIFECFIRMGIAGGCGGGAEVEAATPSAGGGGGDRGDILCLCTTSINTYCGDNEYQPIRGQTDDLPGRLSCAFTTYTSRTCD
ncbi:X-ray repair cross-complementing protein 5, partial [Phlyctochytrium bullatum]